VENSEIFFNFTTRRTKADSLMFPATGFCFSMRAVLARYLWAGKQAPASRERAAADTCPRLPPRAWRAIRMQGNRPRLRENAPLPTHVPGFQRALGALFAYRETAHGFERTRRCRHMSPVSSARLARYSYTGKQLPASRERVAADTCPRFPPRAWRAKVLSEGS